ncbi:E3 ubiquitin-protein ligase Os04g0590900-like [Brachypodium distachyon]|uniref:E3 ubiquitin-protein ligase Os04g0590900-like n=1 Tax=Brachypodium distachyon TaxID=15368 RepID=UPI00052FE63D|nr:E3 ubiquitin-protein ligase Os04g0590900-like [Brachypodium distachyon]|eukprot:XP_010229731.1 E3 ubiquitin-protein ligase Os04g0590900-like [Brachypodium distachyon]
MGGLGAVYMMTTLLIIFGIIGFWFGWCGRRFVRGNSARAEPAEAQGLRPFYELWRAIHGRPAGLADEAIAALPLTKLARAAECAVCLGELAAGGVARLLPLCGHTFHRECVDTWLRSRANCPVCRQTVNEVTGMPRRNVRDAAQPAAQAQAQAPGPVMLPPALPQADGRAPLAQARDGGEGHISLQVLD